MAKKHEVLLVGEVLKLGSMGDIVKVSPGYARNYLFTHALAIPASGAAKRQVEVLREKAAKSDSEREAKANQLKKSLEGTTIQVAARVAHDIDLFGSIGTKDIVQALAKAGVEVDGKQVHLTDKIARLGVYSIEVRLHKKVAVTVKLEVVNSDPNAPSLAEALANYEKEKAAKAAAAKAAKEGAAAEGAEAAAEAPKAEAKAEKPAKGAKGDTKADKPAKKQKG
jgi:large subunit ribosomal protein L9